MDVPGTLTALWQIVVVSLLVGAGVPAVFAVGVRALAEVPAGPAPFPRRLLAGCCFGVASLAVVAGIVLIVLGGR
ncbi:hypothetical protein GC722_15240 [Auraticoccus sp. F435]|uniref:Uncharacterized protein n=1 Tax=Auraticoccus cholistanensis TaxID=2656650 RepID=A0A6A9UZB5_9ACTN|nr:hypothetical protein [Auraticoccus cholistanensis]MVA77365.1 hypothetical protein [Auraticoccus cholistanensis]